MEHIWQISTKATRYSLSDLKVKVYMRWGAYYLLGFEGGSSAFVSIDFSKNGLDFCTVYKFWQGPGEHAPYTSYDELDPPHIAFRANEEA